MVCELDEIKASGGFLPGDSVNLLKGFIKLSSKFLWDNPEFAGFFDKFLDSFQIL